ncbi:transport and Golgi organization protein 6 [Pelomyxa schiedti]|nr:transport and Golgi organization protein 6 [Pelomyxa schiedti]
MDDFDRRGKAIMAKIFALTKPFAPSGTTGSTARNSERDASRSTLIEWRLAVGIIQSHESSGDTCATTTNCHDAVMLGATTMPSASTALPSLGDSEAIAAFISQMDVRWRFVSRAIELVRDLCSVAEEYVSFAENAKIVECPPFLPISAQNELRRVVEIVVVWGIYPCFPEGIAPPLALRSKLPKQELRTTRKGSAEELQLCAEFMLQLIQCRGLDVPVVPYYSLDILVSYIYLCYSPRPNGTGSAYSSTLSYLISRLPVDSLIESIMTLLQSSSQSWFRSVCGVTLSRVLMRKGGLIGLLNATICSPEMSGNAEALHSTVKSILCVPKQLDQQAYLRSMYQQTTEILRDTMHLNTSAQLSNASFEILSSIIGLPGCGAQFLSDILEPFTAFLSQKRGEEPLREDSVLYPDIDIEWRVKLMARLASFTFWITQKHQALVESIPAFFRLWCVCRDSVSPLRKAVTDFVHSFFESSPSAALVLRKLTLCEGIIRWGDLHGFLLDFCFSDSGGIQLQVLRWIETEQEKAMNQEIECLIDLLQDIHSDSLTGTVFTELLSATTEQVGSDYLLRRSFSLLALLCEKFEYTVLKNVVHAISFIKTALRHPSMEVVAVALQLLGLLVPSEESTVASSEVNPELLQPEHLALLFDVLPILEQLRHDGNEAITHTASHILESLTKLMQKTTLAQRPPPVPAPKSTTTPLPLSLQSIISDLSHDLVAVRGHALISLRHKIIERDPTLESHSQTIFDLLVKQLDSPEESIYTAAISGLVSLGAGYNTSAVLPRLTAVYNGSSTSIPTRQKMGEVIVQVSLCQGELLNKYAQIIMHSAFLNLKEKEPLEVRVSALSLLSSVCPLLSHGIKLYATELASALSGILRSASSPFEVLRGATYVVALLFKGLRENLWASLTGEQVRELRYQLEHIRDTSTDSLAREHAQDALENLRTLSLATLNPATLVQEMT